mmetsp:Transcript_1996/g.8771  ORF Transcript_1996/g.8771 Transcript_1996/m.8771 type:complete len:225 (+) Transcript_1996:877-1551(+)
MATDTARERAAATRTPWTRWTSSSPSCATRVNPEARAAPAEEPPRAASLTPTRGIAPGGQSRSRSKPPARDEEAPATTTSSRRRRTRRRRAPRTTTSCTITGTTTAARTTSTPRSRRPRGFGSGDPHLPPRVCTNRRGWAWAASTASRAGFAPRAASFAAGAALGSAHTQLASAVVPASARTELTASTNLTAYRAGRAAPSACRFASTSRRRLETSRRRLSRGT